MQYETLNEESALQFNHNEANNRKFNLGNFIMAAKILVVRKSPNLAPNKYVF